MIDESSMCSIIDSSSSDFDSGILSKNNENTTATTVPHQVDNRHSIDVSDIRTNNNNRNSCNNSCKCQVEIIAKRSSLKQFDCRTIKVNDCDCQKMNSGTHFVDNIGYEKSANTASDDWGIDSMENGYAKVTVKKKDVSCYMLLSFAHQIANGMVSFFMCFFIFKLNAVNNMSHIRFIFLTSAPISEL